MQFMHLVLSSLTGFAILVAGMIIPLVVRANSKPIIVGSKNVSESKTGL